MSSTPAGLQRLLLARERGAVGREDALAFQRNLHFPAHFASKLSVEHTYEGHTGCVNRLGWNSDGSLLVSGSDDKRVIIWHYPDVGRRPLALATEHRANIFGCQFLPCTGDTRIVTGAMDDTVQLHNLDSAPAAAAAAGGWAVGGGAGGGGGGGVGGGGAARGMRRRYAAEAAANLRPVTPRTKVYVSHKDRVKDVKVEPMNPHNFWSGGEDGDVRQYDTRMPNQDKWESPTVFVQVRDGHRTVQVKSLDINKAQPHLMAVAGSDPYIRLYDRRKLDTGHWKRRGATPAVMMLAPPHLPLAAAAAAGRQGRAHATYVSFSNRGDKVVTTYHGDHAYCFDITAAGDMAALFPQLPAAAPRQLPGRQAAWRASLGACGGGGGAREAGGDGGRGSPAEEEESPGRGPGWSSGRSGGGSGSSSGSPLPARADEAKARGNTATFERRWAAAVQAFTEALYFAPGAPVLYALRAEALLRRAWVGDAALALRDCDTAVALDEGCSRAFLSRIQALQALNQYQCALTAVDEYRRRFPGRAAEDVAKLASQLRASVDERRRLYEARRQQHERRRAQRAAVLARTPRRIAPSPPPPRGRRTQAAGAAAAATAAGNCNGNGNGSAPAAPAGAAASTAARRGAAPKPAAGPADGSPASSAPGEGEGEGSSAAQDPTTDCGVGERLEANGAAPMDATEPYIGPPPPPPPYPDGRDDAADADVAASPSSAAEPRSADGFKAADAADIATRSATPHNGFAAAAPAGPVAAAAPPPPPPAAQPREEDDGGLCPSDCAATPPGPAPPGEAEGVGEEEEEAVAMAVDGRRGAGEGGGLEGMEETGQDDDDEEEEEGAARGRPYDEYGSDDDEEEEEEEPYDLFVREGDGAEEDPDLELFLQFYAQAMELVSGDGSGSGSSGSDGSACGGGGTAPSTPLAASSSSRGPQAPAPPAPAARHVPGAWGGSPGGRRMVQRYVGQCNLQTDIKEVNFLGSDDRVVAAGSDCGRVFLYDADSGALLRALPADQDIANCVQCHPTLPVVATSGIESVVRLWTPRDSPPAAAAVSEIAEELAAVVERNQARMKEGPPVYRSALQEALQENPQLLHLVMNQLYGRGIMTGRGPRAGAAGRGPAGGDAGGGGGGEGGEEEEDEDEEGHPEVSCRMA